MTSSEIAKMVWMPPSEFFDDCASASRDAVLAHATVREYSMPSASGVGLQSPVTLPMW